MAPKGFASDEWPAAANAGPKAAPQGGCCDEGLTWAEGALDAMVVCAEDCAADCSATARPTSAPLALPASRSSRRRAREEGDVPPAPGPAPDDSPVGWYPKSDPSMSELWRRAKNAGWRCIEVPNSSNDPRPPPLRPVAFSRKDVDVGLLPLPERRALRLSWKRRDTVLGTSADSGSNACFSARFWSISHRPVTSCERVVTTGRRAASAAQGSRPQAVDECQQRGTRLPHSTPPQTHTHAHTHTHIHTPLGP